MVYSTIYIGSLLICRKKKMSYTTKFDELLKECEKYELICEYSFSNIFTSDFQDWVNYSCHIFHEDMCKIITYLFGELKENNKIVLNYDIDVIIDHGPFEFSIGSFKKYCLFDNNNHLCFNCINSKNCSDCSLCNNCNNCKNCELCNKCNDCNGCFFCKDCQDCVDCNKCSHSSGWIDCEKVRYNLNYGKYNKYYNDSSDHTYMCESEYGEFTDTSIFDSDSD